MKTTAAILIALVLLICSTLLAASAAIGFHAYVEAREALVRKQQSDRMIAAIDEAVDKIPNFKLFQRDTPKAQKNAPPVNTTGRVARVVGR
jgi:hypothetical protein